MSRLYAYILLVIFTVTLPSYSVELHYCQGAITDVALLGSASCVCQDKEQEEKTEVTKCEFHCHSKSLQAQNTDELAHKPCCKTEKLTLSSAKLKASPSSKIEFSAITPVESKVDFFNSLNSQTQHDVFLYRPQNLHKDVTIFLGTLMI